MNPANIPRGTPQSQNIMGIRNWNYMTRVNQQRGLNGVRFPQEPSITWFRSGSFIYGVVWRPPPPDPDTHPMYRQCKPVRRTPSKELLRIDDTDHYVEACAQYDMGVKEGWTDEQLFDMIAEIRKRPSKIEGEDEVLV